MDEVDLKQQQEIVHLQSRDLKQANQISALEGIVARMRARMWIDLIATLLLVALNIALLLYSVEVEVNIIPRVKAVKEAK